MSRARAMGSVGVLCLTLQDDTERPITVSHGTNRVIGVELHAIDTHCRRAAGGQWPNGELPELWDGQVCPHLDTLAHGRNLG